MKNIFKLVTATALTLVITSASIAGPAANQSGSLLTPTTVINSDGSTNLILNFPAWPRNMAGNTLITNFTKVDISGATEIGLEFSCASTNTTTTSNVVWTIYRSVGTRTATNAVGTSLKYDTLGYVTNFLNGTALVTTEASFISAAGAARTAQSADQGVGGMSTLYIGIANIPTLSGLTNVTVRAFPK